MHRFVSVTYTFKLQLVPENDYFATFRVYYQMTTDKGATYLQLISRYQFDQENPDWLAVQIDIPKGGNMSIQLFPILVASIVQPYYAAIDEILITDGECPKEGGGSFNIKENVCSNCQSLIYECRRVELLFIFITHYMKMNITIHKSYILMPTVMSSLDGVGKIEGYCFYSLRYRVSELRGTSIDLALRFLLKYRMISLP